MFKNLQNFISDIKLYEKILLFLVFVFPLLKRSLCNYDYCLYFFCQFPIFDATLVQSCAASVQCKFAVRGRVRPGAAKMREGDGNEGPLFLQLNNYFIFS